MNFESGQIVCHKLTGDRMIVLSKDSPSPAHGVQPPVMFKCRFKNPNNQWEEKLFYEQELLPEEEYKGSKGK